MNSDLKVGQVLEGTVRNIKPYGAFIELQNGIVGLLKIEDISVSRIKSPYERFNLKDKINVVIKQIDEKEDRVFFSHKELLGTWEENANSFQEGTIVKGIVRETEKSNNGIFVELKPNLVGMVEYKEGLKYGQRIDVFIKKIIPEKKKIKLAFKDINEG